MEQQMILGIDLGSSIADIVIFDKKNRKIIAKRSLALGHKKNNLGTQKYLRKMIKFHKLKINEIHVTGYGAAFFKESFFGMPIKKIDEIKAIALGAAFLSGKNSFFVASLGSGTCFVSYRKGKYLHCGGTAIGGKTLLGLAKLVLNIDDFKKLEKLASKGSLKRVDLQLKDIYPQGIGLLDKNATASHFGGITKPRNRDIALGLFNLIAQGIATNALFAAKAHKQKTILMIGRLSESRLIQKIIKEKVQPLFPKTKFIFIKNAGIATACGAAISK